MMICTKEAREACNLAYMCEENAEVTDGSECADLIVKTEVEKWEKLNDINRCKTCQHHYEGQSDYDWCHECAMETDHFKPIEPQKEETE